MAAKLSTPVLDAAHGCPAAGMKIELWSIEGEDRTLVTTAKTNADGRPDVPLLAADEMKTDHYEIVFFAGDYSSAKATPLPKLRFLDKVPVRFGITDAGSSYHVPLLRSPWGYSTYRGS